MDQLRYESDTWKLVLSWIIEENDRLKQQLAHLLEAVFSATLLEQAENFQTRFLEKEAAVVRLRKAVRDFDTAISRNAAIDEEPCQAVLDSFHLLRKNAQQLKIDFTSLKSEFHVYLSAIS